MEEEVRKELNRLKEELAEFERKYFFTGNYKLIANILDKELSVELVLILIVKYHIEFTTKNTRKKD